MQYQIPILNGKKKEYVPLLKIIGMHPYFPSSRQKIFSISSPVIPFNIGLLCARFPQSLADIVNTNLMTADEKLKGQWMVNVSNIFLISLIWTESL